MSDADAISVRFGAETADLRKGVDDAKKSVSSFSDSIRAAFSNVNTNGLTDAFKKTGDSATDSGKQAESSFDSMKNKVLEVTGVIGVLAVAATAYLLKTGDAAVQFGEQIKTAAGAFDQTTASISQIKAIADRSGIGLDELGKSFFDMQTKAKDGDDAVVKALDVIGVKAKDVASMSQDALAVKLADAFSKSADSSNKAAVGVALFGEGVAGKLVPQLDQGAAHMADLEAAANRAGVVIGPDLMSKIDGTNLVMQRMKDAFAELAATTNGILLQSFQQFKPAIDGIVMVFTDVIKNVTSLVEWFNDLDGAAQKNTQSTSLMAQAATLWATTIVRVTSFLEELSVRGVQYIETLGVSFNGLSAVAVAFGNDIRAMASTSAAALYEAYHDAISGVVVLFGDLAAAGKAALSFDLSGVRAQFSQFGTDADTIGGKIKTALAPAYFSGTAKAIGDMRAAAAQESAALDQVIAKLEAQKQKQLEVIAAGGAKGPAAGTKKVANPAVDDSDDGKADAEKMHAAMAEIDGEIAVLRKAQAEKEEIYNTEAKLKILSESEKLSASTASIDTEYAAEKALLQKKLALDDLSLAQKQQINAKLNELDEKHSADSQKALDQATVQMAQTWDKMVDSMSNSLSSGLLGMIEGTKSFSQVVKSLAQTLVGDFLRMGIDIVANWVKSQIGMAAASILNNTKITASNTAAAAAQVSTATGAAAASTAAQQAAQVPALANDVKTAFGGFLAFLAPILGPAAPAAAAGLAASVPAFATGSWELPGDTFAQVHAGEMIVPASATPWAQSLMANAAGGGQGGQSGQGGGDVHAHFHVNAIDAAGVKQFFGAHSKTIIGALNQGIKNGNHIGLRNLGRS